jgi:hypothetical protein
MTFKGERELTSARDAHVASRLEDEVDVPDDYAARVTLHAPLPDDVALTPLRRARAIVAEAPLIATALLDNERISIVLVGDAGATLELAIDHVSGTRLSDGRQVVWDEVELESKGASRELLLQTAEALREVAPSLLPNHITKLERVLGHVLDES